MKNILLNQRDCIISISPNGSKDLAAHIKNIRGKHYSGIAIISDETVHKLHGSAIRQQLSQLQIPCLDITIPAGEKSKTLATAEMCWTKMLNHKLDKNALIVALGGGTVIEIAGYVASCYMRGVDFISIPTTLMSMIDTAIGGNTSIGLSKGLDHGNIGTIHYPKLILVDSQFLTTLPFRHLQNGLAQAIKYAVAHDIELFVLLEKFSAKDILKGKLAPLNQIIERACDIKADIIRRSFRQDVQDLLQWGCTLGKALHTATGNTFLEGETTSIGMCYEMHLSFQMGLADAAFVERHEALCTTYNLPTTMPKEISLDDLVSHIPTEAKESSKYTFFLAHKIGKVIKHFHINKDDLAKILSNRSSTGKQSLKRSA
jgi:3-dehydroquinate synthase